MWDLMKHLSKKLDNELGLNSMLRHNESADKHSPIIAAFRKTVIAAGAAAALFLGGCGLSTYSGGYYSMPPMEYTPYYEVQPPVFYPGPPVFYPGPFCERRFDFDDR